MSLERSFEKIFRFQKGYGFSKHSLGRMEKCENGTVCADHEHLGLEPAPLADKNLIQSQGLSIFPTI